MLTERANAQKLWQQYWEINLQAPIKKNNHMSTYQLIFYDYLQKLITKGNYVNILSAGCGQDLISLKLQKVFNNQLNIVLLDVVPEAIAWNRQNFQSYKLRAEYKVGDIFHMPFADQTFDLVFNTGVMEHFNAGDQINITKETMRVLKPGGVFVTANPSDSGVIYKFSMKVAIKNHRWPFGYEVPVVSLHFLRHSLPEIASIEEFNQDFVTQLNFLSYVSPCLRFFTFPWRYLCRSLFWIKLSDRLCAAWLGAYLVTSVIRKLI